MSLIFLALTGSPTISGTIWVVDGITGSRASANIAFSMRRGCLLAPRARPIEALRWRTLASAPATSTGDSEVVKMKPGA